MSETIVGLRRKITSAEDLQSVVRSMKALAASSIGQYEQAMLALDEYYRTVELGLGACLRTQTSAPPLSQPRKSSQTLCAIVFGSDQGLVGSFNDVVADYTIEKLASQSQNVQVWAVGERVHARLADAGLPLADFFAVPNSVQGITPLIGQILVASEENREGDLGALHIFHNRPTKGAVYEVVDQRLLPLDESWQSELATRPWPTTYLPEVLGCTTTVLQSLIRDYVFISLFRSCAESLAAENASRLAAMQRADKNIDELRESLNSTYHQLRQGGIDEELFDLISGFEALSTKEK